MRPQIKKVQVVAFLTYDDDNEFVIQLTSNKFVKDLKGGPVFTDEEVVVMLTNALDQVVGTFRNYGETDGVLRYVRGKQATPPPVPKVLPPPFQN